MAVSWPTLKNFIAGEFVAAEPREQPLIDPSDGSLIGEQMGTRAGELEAALVAASHCHRTRSWQKLGEKRADYLLAIASGLEKELDALATIEACNTGVVISQTQRLARLLPLIFKGAAQQLLAHPDKSLIDGRLEHWHMPWGPALCLGPWNSPGPIGAHKIASALAAGAPVIFKPSEYTPFSAQKIMEVIAACDLPQGAVQLIHGAAAEGSALARDTRIKAVSFTGGLRGGQSLAMSCGPQMKPLQLELGGHNPFVVMPGADLDKVVSAICEGLTTLNGQWCRAIGRIFVPEAMKYDLIARVMQALSGIRIGAASDPKAQMGPLIHRGHKLHLEQMLHDHAIAGARIWTAEQELPLDSCYFAPRLISDLDPTKDREEMFGPLASVHGYRDASELSECVNDSPYGLAAYIYGPDQEACFELARSLEVGSTKINGISLTSLSPRAPRVAWGLSGLGEEGEFESFRFFQGNTLIGTLTP